MLSSSLCMTLVNDESTLNYQRAVNLKTGRITTCEVPIC